MRKILITIVAVLTLSSTSHAQTNYYVSPQGSDYSHSGRSLNDAWRTIQRAANMLQAGDTVFITSGIYNEHVIPKNSGNANHYITYTVYPGDTAIIDGTTSGQYLNYSDRGIFDIKSKKYINVIGLTLRNSNKGGGIMCRYGSSHINIENNHIYDCGATGIGAGYSRESHPLATNIVARGNLLERCSLNGRESLSFRSVVGFEISNNIVRDTPREGIDAKSGCSDGIISNNYVFNARAVGIYIDAGYPDPLYTSSHNIHVYGNVCDSCVSPIAIASEERCPGEDIWIYNNIITNAPYGNGIVVANFVKSGPLKDIYIINNTIYNSNHRGIYINNFNVRNIYIRNNICSQNQLAQIALKPPSGNNEPIDSVYIENNLIYGTNINHGIFPVFGNPGFVNASAGDFHLLATSPAIDKGTAVDAPSVDFDSVMRPRGGQYDIGAYEYPTVMSSIDLNEEDNVFCYPNPAKGRFFVEGDHILSIQLINNRGQFIQQIEVNDRITTVNLGNTSKGMHIVRVVTTKGTSLKKIIVQ